MPRSSGGWSTPSIVKVLPVPVCPYLNIQTCRCTRCLVTVTPRMQCGIHEEAGTRTRRLCRCILEEHCLGSAWPSRCIGPPVTTLMGKPHQT
eukprot:5612632-Pleurochrysis_carterae.AAC.2